jgi:Predicted transcriptional regulator with C-terminal CBS domains
MYFTCQVNSGGPVDVCFVIQQRLKELGLEQRDLAVAAQVTESYISQLLTRKKSAAVCRSHRSLRQDERLF